MTTKFNSPLLGYNNNVRHKGRVFHIQTEDSGVKYGHIITHLFMDGGRILKSVKTSYSEYIGGERMTEIVREMMKQQHKAMFIALRDGKLDTIADGSVDPSQTTIPSAPSESPPSVRPPAAPPAAPAAARPSASRELPAAQPVTPLHSAPTPESEEEAPPTVRQAPPELALDLDALERAAAAEAAAPVLRRPSELPPPPANLFREKPRTGRYRTVAPAPDLEPVLPKQPAPTPPSERRFAPTRPSSIFRQVRPPTPKSAFGEDLISDKSLDEVILSYLADDLDERKK